MTPIRKDCSTGKKQFQKAFELKMKKKALIDLAPLRVCFIRKAVIKNAQNLNIDEIVFYLKKSIFN